METPKVTLTPKKGKWRNGDQPFEIPVSELDKYTSIEHTVDGAKENPFLRAVIEYPLPICKEGIEFVDSPGLDDPTSHDEVTMQYLPTADAIIYCMNSLAAYSSKDRDEIDSLRAMGYKSIIFVLTYYDKLIENDEMMESHDADDLKTHIFSKLAPLTDLGKSGIFFVNSLAAIKGKMKNDTALLQSSNFPDLEEKIEQILVNQRGRLKLTRSVYQAKGINKRAGKYLKDSIEITQKDHTVYANKLSQAQATLAVAQQKSDNVERSIKLGIKDISSEVRDKGVLFLMRNIIPSLEAWVNEYEPDEGINLLHLKSSIQKYTEAHIHHIKSKMSVMVEKWCESDLVRAYIEPKLERLLIEQGDSLKRYEEDLSRVRVTLELPIDGDKIGGGVTPSIVNRLTSTAGSIVIGDVFGAITGGVLGFKAMLTTLAMQLTTSIVLGIASMFTPVGLPAMIVAAVLSTIGGIGTNVLSIKNNVKKKIINEAKDLLSAGDKQREFGESIEKAVNSFLKIISDKIHTEMQTPIAESQKLVDNARNDMNKTGAELERKANTLRQLLIKQEETDDALDSFNKAMNLSLY